MTAFEPALSTMIAEKSAEVISIYEYLEPNPPPLGPAP